jgi:hypothetical protein
MPVAPDNFINCGGAGLGAPYFGGAAVTPSDTVDNEFPQVSRGLYVTVSGAVAMKMADGSTVTLTLPVGEFKGRVRQVFATGTTATGISAVW